MGKWKARCQFGRSVRDLRIKYGWTQEKLAKRAGLSKRYLQKIEGKDPPNVSVDTIKKIAHALKCEMPALLK